MYRVKIFTDGKVVYINGKAQQVSAQVQCNDFLKDNGFLVEKIEHSSCCDQDNVIVTTIMVVTRDVID